MWHRQFATCLMILVSTASTVGSWASNAKGSPIGAWSAAASLIAGREEHTATLLQNGKVLVIGGTDGRGKALASAERYDPKANQWEPAGTMATMRFDHTATLLPGGKVLVAGGLGRMAPSSTLASVELYDPITNAWSAAPPMSVGRARHTATLLLDGRVLVIGGLSVTPRDGGLFPNQSVGAEIYDPMSNRWSATAQMSLYRHGHSATLLHDGRVLVAGGLDASAASRTTEIYDPGQARWLKAAPTTTGRAGQRATLLPNGDVFLMGGQGPQTAPPYPYGVIPVATAEVYDPRVDRWSPVASMAGTRIGHTSTLLSNGTVLVVGNAGPTKSQAEAYDPIRNSWSNISEPMDRYDHAAAQLPDGRVLIIGGYGIESLDSVLIYDPRATPLAPRGPANLLVVAGLLLAMLLLLTAGALLIPNVRQRFADWRRRAGTDEWIT